MVLGLFLQTTFGPLCYLLLEASIHGFLVWGELLGHSATYFLKSRYTGFGVGVGLGVRDYSLDGLEILVLNAYISGLGVDGARQTYDAVV